MPCRSDYMEPNHRQELDRLTRENDMLREAVLSLQAGKGLPDAALMLIQEEQIKHRKEDLQRLAKVFRTAKDAPRLGAVMLADPRKPLEPQLEFDPDAY